ncbi:MAG: RIP metalloprotease RseP [Hyphomicrobiaceae bacterium]
MTFLASLTSSVGTTMLYLASFLVVLTIVVFIHEMGHFLVARWCGVKVSAFSIGFGKEIFGFVDKHGTRWRFAWIPLGGYVKFMDDASAASTPSGEPLEAMTPEERAGSFHHKPLWRRAAVVAAGPVANFLFAIVIFACMFSIVGQRTTVARVDEVVKGMPADLAGFKKGDVIVAIAGRQVKSFHDVLRLVSSSPDRELAVRVMRDEKEVLLTVTPKPVSMNDRIGGQVTRGLIGIKRSPGPDGYTHHRAGPLEAVVLGVKETEFIISSTLSYIADVVIMRQPPDQLGGIIRIADVSGKVARVGPEAFIHLIAVLSISVGLINLFPIPLLDGGHLLFYAIEAVRGRPLSDSSQEFGFKIGFALVLSLMVFATWNDRGVVARWLDIKTTQNQSQ